MCRLATECIRFIIETFAATLGNLVKLTENHMQIYETVFLSAGFAYEMSSVQIFYSARWLVLILLITSMEILASATFFLFLLDSFWTESSARSS